MNENKDVDAMFAQLVMQFQSAALIQLGYIANPQSNKVEKNLQQAKYFIDMLVMIQEKTKGNLSEEESKLISSTVSNLQMNFINAGKEEKEKK